MFGDEHSVSTYPHSNVHVYAAARSIKNNMCRISRSPGHLSMLEVTDNKTVEMLEQHADDTLI